MTNAGHFPPALSQSLKVRQSLHLLPLRHRADGSLFGGGQAGSRVGKAEHPVQIAAGQAIQAVFRHEVQHAGTEGIPRANGLNGAAP